MTKRYSHEDLRSWGASLDREQPQGLGETLLCYADDWRAEVERLRAAVAAEREACAKVCEELAWLYGVLVIGAPFVALWIGLNDD